MKPLNYLQMSLFLGQYSDLLLTRIFDWLDARSLQLLDIVIMNVERNSLREMKSAWRSCFDSYVERKVLNGSEENHLSIRWRIDRKVRSSNIHFQESERSSICDGTFKDIKMASLLSIDLIKCFLISDVGVCDITRGCAQLLSISLNCCKKLTDFI